MNDQQGTTGMPGLRNGTPFRVSVEFLTDWSCATGTGRHGAVDREVQRDDDGLPMLRGKALAAVLRDAAETVVAGFDQGTDGLWHRWLDVVFGGQPAAWSGNHAVQGGVRSGSGPRRAALQARPLRLAEPVRAAIAELEKPSRELVRAATVVFRPGVRIDSLTGVAADDTFRIEERASAGLTVVADWRLTFDRLAPGTPVPWEAELLLRAAAKLVDAVGGRRRRGAGRCRVAIGGVEADDRDRLAVLLDRIESARPPAEKIGATGVVVLGAEPLGARSTRLPRRRYDLRITTLTPLLVAAQVIGNSVRAERFLPGTALLPAVARALGSRATELITSGQVVVTNATIEIDGQRSLPVPRSLHREKGKPDGDLINLLRNRADDGLRLKPVNGFCVGDDRGVRLAEPALVAQAHAVIDDEQQRPNERSGGLYVYEAIVPGTVLRAELWLPDGVPLNAALLTGERGIGRSSKDDYGHVRIEVREPSQADEPAGVVADQDELVVWLLSDVLLRGEAGQPVADVDHLASSLGAALGVTLALPATGETPAALVTTRRVESWQDRWSLPRPSLTGLAAGTVVRFTMTGTPSPAAYQRVQACGLGERTAEGFGRLALQPRLLTGTSVPARSGTEDAAPGSPEPSPTRPRPGIVDELLLRGWRAELRRRALLQASKEEVRELFVPKDASAAQLGTLRTLTDRLAVDDDTASVLAWIDGTKQVGRRREAWTAARLDRLHALVTDPGGQVWQRLGVTPPPEVAVRLAGPAVAWLLAEVARAQVKARADGSAEGPQGARDDREVLA